MSLRFLTAGESHGKALIGILEGVPAGLEITLEDLAKQAGRRKLGYGRGARMKIETDQVEILSGVRFGRTTGAPIALIIENKDFSTWKDVMTTAPGELPERSRKVTIPRPGHADLVGGIKYRHADLRDALERASARETAMRVALGTIARKLLSEIGIEVASRVLSIGGIEDRSTRTLRGQALNDATDASQVRCLGKEAESEIVKKIEAAKKDGDTLGGIFEVVASGVPIGLGSYAQWDRRLEGRLSQALMALNAIKGVEVGMGFQGARVPGSQVHDEYVPLPEGRVGYASNRSGGIDAGISTGQEILVQAAMKPIATLMKPLKSVDLGTGEAAPAQIERSDVCAVPAAAVISESLVALTLADAVLEKFGGDSMEELKPRVERWRKEARPVGSNLAHRIHGVGEEQGREGS